MKPIVRLIGLKLGDMDSSISKVLKEGWYPFGNYPEPDKDGYINIDDMSMAELSAYRLRGQLPQITVSCVVGMNGSGKSTIIDIIYRIINNLAFKTLDYQTPKVPNNLEYVEGVYADLYFEINDRIRFIRNWGKTVSLYTIRKNRMHGGVKQMTLENAKNLLEQFFYTIGVNYSLYAYNLEDYFTDYDGSNNGDWYNGVFHKNDGYLVPLTLVPFRDRGNIDIQKENLLARQRIAVLAILSRIKRIQFPEGYHPYMLHFWLLKDFEKKKLASFTDAFKRDLKNVDGYELIKMFKEAWDWLFQMEKINIQITDKEECQMALFYLSYKAAKICLTYHDYRETLRIESISGVDLRMMTKALVRTLWTTHDHITMKIHQCLYYLETKWWERFTGEVYVRDFIRTENLKTYDDVCKCMPPPFYYFDITFKKVPASRRGKKDVSVWKEKSSWNDDKGDMFKLSAMSSGEKQMLTAISYILYHLRNLQSIWNTDFRVKYHYVNIIFDEVELYFHPEYQRKFLSMLIESLSWTQIDKRKIKGIHFLIATHSPFVLTDILTERTLYLKDGIRQKVENQTFGGNYYDLLDGSFFFENTAIGEISAKAIKKWVFLHDQHGTTPSEEVMRMVGDPYVKRYLQIDHREISKGDVSTKKTID
jgi:hypothetical protein